MNVSGGLSLRVDSGDVVRGQTWTCASASECSTARLGYGLASRSWVILARVPFDAASVGDVTFRRISSSRAMMFARGCGRSALAAVARRVRGHGLVGLGQEGVGEKRKAVALVAGADARADADAAEGGPPPPVAVAAAARRATDTDPTDAAPQRPAVSLAAAADADDRRDRRLRGRAGLGWQ